MAAGSAAVLSSFLLNLYICFGCFGFFCWVRNRPWCRRFFASRRFATDLDLKPKRLPNGWVSWIAPTLQYKEEDIIDEAGLDCAIYLRILTFGLYLFFGASLWCLVVVLPANLTSKEIERLLSKPEANNATVVNGQEYKFTDFDNYSLSNVESSSAKMWAHLVSVYFVVLYTIWLLSRFNRESVLLRLMFLGNAKRGGPSHTVLLTDVPAVSGAVSKNAKLEKQASKATKSETKSAASAASASAKVKAKAGGTSEQDLPVSYSAQQDVESQVPQLQDVAADTLAGKASKPAGKSGTHAAVTSMSGASDASSAPLPVLRPTPQPQSGSSRMMSFWKATPQQSADGISVGSYSRASPGTTPVATPPRVSVCGSVTSPNGINVTLGDGMVTQAAEAAASGPSSNTTLGAAGPESIALSFGGPAGGGAEAEEDLASLYAATGGKLEQPRVPGAPSADELLADLEVPEVENQLAVKPEWGVDLSPQLPNRRTTKRYDYNLGDTSLDAAFQAKQQLSSGKTPQQMIAQDFALVYGPKTISAVNMVQDTSALEPLAEEYNKIREQLEDYLDMVQLRLKLRKGIEHKKVTVLGAMYGDWGKEHIGTKWFKKMDAVDFWLARLKFLRGRIIEEQAVAARKDAPSALVTMKTRMAQAVSSNSMHHHNITTWRVQNAPAPFEVIWKNLGMTMPEKSSRNTMLWIAFWAMTLFFMIPVTLIQALIEVPKLADIPVLGAIVTAPGVRQILEAIVPGLVLKIFLAVVPIILRFMAILSGATSLSEVDFGVVKRFFLFQVVVVFFGNIIAGSFFNQVTQFIENPTGVFGILGKAIPMTSTFFITYLLTNGLGVKSIAFIRLPGFVIYWLLSKFAGSPRARQRLWMNQYTDNGTTVVDHTMCMLIGLAFSCINPIVCPAALAYFIIASIGERYNNIYVFRRAYESAGKLWQTVYSQVMISLYIFQITMLGLLALKTFKFTPLLFPLLFFTVGCHISTMNLYRRPWSLTALHDAADLDMWEAQRRREELQKLAKKERKEAARKRAAAITATAAEEGKALLLSPGPSELRLRRAVRDDAAALELTPDEQREIADVYKNPCFKVSLKDLESVEALALDLRPRLTLLNTWTAELKKAGKKPNAPAPGPPPNGLSSKPAMEAERPPHEVTKYDDKPDIDGNDDDSSEP